jgi:hypothetical protein
LTIILLDQHVPKCTERRISVHHHIYLVASEFGFRFIGMKDVFLPRATTPLPFHHLSFADETPFREEIFLEGPASFEVRRLSEIKPWEH